MTESRTAVAGIGHNSAFDFFSYMDMVLASSASTVEKLISIVHGRQIARKNAESYLSRSKAQAQASVSDNTYQRALPVVRVFLEDTSSRGRATTWKARPQITTESIEEAILAMRARPQDTPKVSPKRIPHHGVYPTESDPPRGMGIPHGGVAPYPTMVGHKDQSKDKSKYEEKKEHPASSESVAARGMHDEVEGLNGATITMQMAIAKWMSPIMPRHQEARTWLTNTVKLFGSDVVRDAFASVEAKHAQGDIVASPIKLMTSICQQKAAERSKSAATKNPARCPDGVPESVWRQIQENTAKGEVPL